MNTLEVDRVLRAFESEGVLYKVFGGAAINILGLPRLVESMRQIWELAEITCGYRFPRGVYKFRSIEEMKAQKEKWAKENFRKLQERRKNEKG